MIRLRQVGSDPSKNLFKANTNQLASQSSSPSPPKNAVRLDQGTQTVKQPRKLRELDQSMHRKIESSR